MDVTSPDLHFAKVRERIEKTTKTQQLDFFDLSSITGTCRWVSANDLYCFGNKQAADSAELLSFFEKYPHARSLRDFSEHLCDHAFCELHSAVAKAYCSAHEIDAANAGAFIKREEGDESKQQAPGRQVQWLRSGDDDQLQVSLGEEPKEEEVKVIHDPKTREVRLQSREAPPGTAESKPKKKQKSSRTTAAHVEGSEAESKPNDIGKDDTRDQTPTTKANHTNITEDDSKSKEYPTFREEKAAKTRRRDSIHLEEVAQAERKIVDLMQTPLNADKMTPGYVYAFRDREINLVKVGSTKQLIRRRLGSIKNACHIGMPMKVLAGENVDSLFAYQHLEKLIHLYLRPHRWYFRCVCGKKDDTRHQEYFNIGDEVAVNVFSLWRSFIMGQPYNNGLYSLQYTLRPEWMERLRKRESPGPEETHEHHDTKLSRWRRILNPSGDEMPDSKTAVDLKQEILASNKKPIQSADKLEKIDRPLPVTPEQKKQSIRQSVAAPGDGLSGSPLTVPTQPLKATRSVSSTPRPKSPATVPTLKSAALWKDGDAINWPLSAPKESDLPARPASSAGEKTLFGSSKPTLAKSLFPANFNPTFSFTAPIPSRPSSPYGPQDKADQAHLDGPSTIPREEHPLHSQDSSTTANSKWLGLQRNSNWSAEYIELEKVLYRPRQGLPSRTICEDLVEFRWPLAFVVCLAAYSPHIPSLLTLVVWILFLPCFVAELRLWFPEPGNQK